MKKIIAILLLAMISLGLQAQTNRSRAFERNQNIQKGINWCGLNWAMYYNMAPEKDMKTIKERGFQSVRIPIDWMAFVDDNYLISPAFFLEVDKAIQSALNNKLFPSIDIVNGGDDPAGNYTNFLYIWDQVATRYAGWSDSLMFEILGEPAPNFTIQLYNQFQREALRKIRETNPNRIVVITVAGWSDFSYLAAADIPDDPNLIFTLHNYSTHEITHQASFLGEYSNAWLGTVWSGSMPEYTQMESFAQSVKEFSDAFKIPMNIGEFGCLSNAGVDTKYRWLNTMSRLFDQYNISWSVWDFGFNVDPPIESNSSLYFITDNYGWLEPLISGVVDDATGTPKNNTATLFEHNFESGIAPFELSFWNPVQDKVSVTRRNGEAKITVTQSLANDWDAHLSCHFDSLQVGHYYSLSVDLWADTFRTVTIGSSYSSIPLLVTPTKRKYCNVFRVNNQIDYSPYFRVYAGMVPGSFYVDNFKIEEINVNLANSIKIDQHDLVIDSVLGKYQLSATVLPENSDERSIKWTIKNNEIATIDKFGILRPTGKAEGSLWVYATTTDGTKLTDSTKITFTNQQTGKLRNGSFSQGFSYWKKQGGRIYTEITNDSTLYVQTYLVTTANWDAFVAQYNVSLEKGKTYQFKFKAKADTLRNISLMIGKTDLPWTHYFYMNNCPGCDVEVALSKSWQEFTYRFTMNETTDDHSVVQFNFGNSAINWNIDDITLENIPAGAGTITGSSSVCQGQNSVTYTVPTITDATTYIWTLPSGTAGTSVTNSIAVNYGISAVSGTITVKGHNENGDGNASSLAITVNATPATAGTITGMGSVCQGQNAVTYTVLAIANATSYVWTLPSGTTGTSVTNSISVNYSNSAISGNITVKGHNSCGDGAESTLAITVNPLPLRAGIVNGTTTVCQGQNAVTYTVPAIANATSYVWTLPSGTTGTSVTNSITVNYSNSAISGNITVKGHNSCGDGAASTLAITVNAKPLTPTITKDGALLRSNAINGNQWYNLDGFITGAANQDYSPLTSGDYYVIVSLNGCTSEPSNTINFIPTSVELTGSTKSINVYPNPVANELVIEMAGNKTNIDFAIVNSRGQVVYSGVLAEKSVVPTASFSPGMYLLKLGSGSVFEFKKVMKR
jgi:hypothetical protein